MLLGQTVRFAPQALTAICAAWYHGVNGRNGGTASSSQPKCSL